MLLTWASMLGNHNDDGKLWRMPFFLAAKNGRDRVVQLLMNSKSFDDTFVDRDCHTSLMAAIAHNQVSVVRVILEDKGPDSLVDNEDVPDLIDMAAERGLVRILGWLLSFGVEDDVLLHIVPIIAERHSHVMGLLVELRGFREKSPVQLRAKLLGWALHSGNVRIAQLICEARDAALYREYQYFHDEDVLHTAAHYNHPEVITTLLERDETDPNLIDMNVEGMTPLMVAAENDSAECISALLRNPRTQPDLRGSNGRTALMYATRKGCPRSLQQFQSCDPNNEDKFGYSTLELAMIHENPSAIEYLLCRDDLDLDNAFFDALKRKNVEVAGSILAQNRFDPNVNSLHFAVVHDERVVGLLVSRSDVDPNQSCFGESPLFTAIEKNKIEAIRLLLAREDTDPDFFNDGMRTPLEVAVMHGRKQAIELLLAREDLSINRGSQPPLLQALSYNDEQFRREIASLLLSDHRIDIHQKDVWGHNALTRSASIGDVTILRQLLSKDSTLDVNYRVPGGDTALLLAVKSGHEPAVQYLLDIGADANAQNDSNQTPLHAAAYNLREGLVNLLIDRGANPNLLDKDGNTPYIAAIRGLKLIQEGFSILSDARMSRE